MLPLSSSHWSIISSLTVGARHLQSRWEPYVPFVLWLEGLINLLLPWRGENQAVRSGWNCWTSLASQSSYLLRQLSCPWEGYMPPDSCFSWLLVLLVLLTLLSVCAKHACAPLVQCLVFHHSPMWQVREALFHSGWVNHQQQLTPILPTASPIVLLQLLEHEWCGFSKDFILFCHGCCSLFDC